MVLGEMRLLHLTDAHCKLLLLYVKQLTLLCSAPNNVSRGT